MRMQNRIERATGIWESLNEWVFPSTLKSLAFVVTEIGEAIDAYLRTDGDDGFVRNNVDKPEEGWETELADVVFQCYITAIVAGVDLDGLLSDKVAKMNAARLERAGYFE